MSLGGAIAIALATERNFGEILLADFDNLELANLNRISFGIHQLGMPKVILTARKIAEIDPYLNVEVFPEGICDSTIEPFINNHRKLDLIIEECDNIEVKYKTRVYARKQRIPVLMQTNAKPMLDVERFDLEPQRALFHGRIKDISKWDWKKIKKLVLSERLNYLLQFVGEEGLTDILKISLDEMGKSLSGFCQPASTFTLGSGLACEMARLILLNKHQLSGRYIFDIDAWLAGPPVENKLSNQQVLVAHKMTA
jgi:molybdopterin/thiamine biosynthesis adenylyltransferase